MGTLAVLDRRGDTKTSWDPDNADEVTAARNLYDELVGKRHYSAFTVEEGGRTGERMREFDPDVEEMILVPQMVGG